MKFAAIAVGVILSSGLLFAQDAPKPHTMTGCLKAGTNPGTYVLENTGTGPKTVGIVSSDANLGPHVGHKVELTGVAVPNDQAKKDNKDVAEAQHYMKITAMKHVAPTCP